MTFFLPLQITRVSIQGHEAVSWPLSEHMGPR
ncbi:hypothetical protein VD0002_g4117 [Verticillium dahliae]|nr:hypothetical protein VD0002_g4117 [Verticillium dahliae]